MVYINVEHDTYNGTVVHMRNIGVCSTIGYTSVLVYSWIL